MTDRKHADCEALLKSLSDYIDGALAPELCQEIEQHLAGCTNCRVVLNTTKRSIDLVREPTGQPAPADVRDRLFSRLNLDEYLRRDQDRS